MRKKIITVILFITMAVAFAGCSKSKNETEKVTSQYEDPMDVIDDDSNYVIHSLTTENDDVSANEFDYEGLEDGSFYGLYVKTFDSELDEYKEYKNLVYKNIDTSTLEEIDSGIEGVHFYVLNDVSGNYFAIAENDKEFVCIYFSENFMDKAKELCSCTID